MFSTILSGALSVARSLGGGGAVGAGLFDGLKGNRNDKKRIATAQSSLQKALNGDASAVEWMKSQADNSATAVGKEAYRRALREYYRIAQQGGAPSTDVYAPALQTSPVQGVVNRAIQDVRNTTGNAISTIATGAGVEVGARVTGDGPGANRPTALPIDQNTIMLLAVGAGAFLLLRKRDR